MRYILGLWLLFGLSSSSLADKVVCSQRVVNDVTSGAVFASSSDTLYAYITKIQSINDNTIDFWTIGLYTLQGRKNYNNTKIGYNKTLYSYNYKENKITLLALIHYDCNGNSLYGKTYESYDIEWNYIIPGTNGEATVAKVIEILKKSSEQR